MNARARGGRLRARYAYLHELRLESRAERRVEEGRDRGQVRRDGAADDVRDFHCRHDAQEEELRRRVREMLARRGVREVLEDAQALRLRRAVPFARQGLHRRTLLVPTSVTHQVTTNLSVRDIVSGLAWPSNTASGLVVDTTGFPTSHGR